MKRIVLDPNIWVTLAWSNNFVMLSTAMENDCMFYSSKEAYDELREVLQRKKFSVKIPESLKFHLYRSVTVNVTPEYVFQNSPDAKDNYLFDICREAKAHYFVTGDKKLLAMETVTFGRHITQIISLTHFKELLR